MSDELSLELVAPSPAFEMLVRGWIMIEHEFGPAVCYEVWGLATKTLPAEVAQLPQVAAALEDAEEEIRFAEPDSRAPDDATM
jgi:hypothetical protein